MRNDLSGLIINIIANCIFQTVSAVKTTRSGEEDNVTDYNHMLQKFFGFVFPPTVKILYS